MSDSESSEDDVIENTPSKSTKEVPKITTKTTTKKQVRNSSNNNSSSNSERSLPNCFPFTFYNAHQTTLNRIYAVFSYVSQFLTEISLIPTAITLIIGSGFLIADLYAPAAALWVASYSIWVGHPLGLLLSSLPPLFVIRTLNSLFYAIFAVLYFTSLVLLIVGASLYIGPAAGVDGTKNAGSILYIIGSAFYLAAFIVRQADIYYELINIREKAEVKRLEKKKRRVREVRKWGDGFQATSGVIIGLLLLTGSVLISGWLDHGGEIMGAILWIIAGVVLFIGMAGGILGIRPKGRMEVESERKKERAMVEKREEVVQLSPKVERVRSQDVDDDDDDVDDVV